MSPNQHSPCCAEGGTPLSPRYDCFSHWRGKAPSPNPAVICDTSMTVKNATSSPTAAAAASIVAAYAAGTSANSPTAGLGFQTVVSDSKRGPPADTEPPDLANNWILTAQHSVTFVFSFLIALASLILNSILVAGMRKDCRLRHITYYYLTSLSVAMLFLGLCDFPPSVLYELLPLGKWEHRVQDSAQTS